MNNNHSYYSKQPNGSSLQQRLHTSETRQQLQFTTEYSTAPLHKNEVSKPVSSFLGSLSSEQRLQRQQQPQKNEPEFHGTRSLFSLNYKKVRPSQVEQQFLSMTSSIPNQSYQPDLSHSDTSCCYSYNSSAAFLPSSPSISASSSSSLHSSSIRTTTKYTLSPQKHTFSFYNPHQPAKHSAPLPYSQSATSNSTTNYSLHRRTNGMRTVFSDEPHSLYSSSLLFAKELIAQPHPSQ